MKTSEFLLRVLYISIATSYFEQLTGILAFITFQFIVKELNGNTTLV